MDRLSGPRCHASEASTGDHPSCGRNQGLREEADYGDKVREWKDEHRGVEVAGAVAAMELPSSGLKPAASGSMARAVSGALGHLLAVWARGSRPLHRCSGLAISFDEFLDRGVGVDQSGE